MTLIGSHINSNLESIINDTQRVYNNGGNLVQLFVNISSKKAKLYYKKFNNFLIINKIKCIVHASYTINCAQNWDYYSWWINQFIMEIHIANDIGAFAIVIHLGKQLDLSIEECLNNMITSLLYVHNQTIKYKNIKILIETSTGQGSELCYKLEDLSYFYNKFSKHNNKEIVNRFGLCVDTCHIFAAGYDITNKNNIKIYFDQFDKLIGLQNIKLIHLNDSKKDIGSHIDRHANIGYGFIGKHTLLLIANIFKKLNVPIILETPYNKQIDDIILIK